MLTLESIKKVKLNLGDVILVKFLEPISGKLLASSAKQLNNTFPDNKHIFLSSDIEFSVIIKKDIGTIELSKRIEKLKDEAKELTQEVAGPFVDYGINGVWDSLWRFINQLREKAG